MIVADGFSTDETVPTVRRLQGEFANLKLVYNPGRFSSAGRNTAIRHAAKDVAVVVDGHCHVPDRNYLKNLAAAFDASGADSLGRPQPLDVPNPTPFQVAVSAARAAGGSPLGSTPSMRLTAKGTVKITTRMRVAWMSEMVRMSPPSRSPRMIISASPPGTAEK